MYIISQDKKHLINLDHIVSIDAAQTGPSVEVTARPAHSLTGEERCVLGIFEDEKQAAMILEFIALCKCKGPEKITVIPPRRGSKGWAGHCGCSQHDFQGKGQRTGRPFRRRDDGRFSGKTV